MGERYTPWLLSMLAVLMVAHLGLLYVGIWECDSLFRLQIEQAARLAKTATEQITVQSNNQECSNVEDDFSKTAAQYIAVILALLSGGVVVKKDPPP